MSRRKDGETILRSSAVVAVLLAVSLMTAEVRAQDGAEIFGTYHYTRSFDHGRGVILGAFERSIKTIPAIFRPLVRGRIHRANLMVSVFDISRSSDQIIFRALAPTRWTWDLEPGVPEQVTTPTGGQAEMIHHVRGRRYIQTFDNSRVDQQMVYTLQDDGRQMRVDTQIALSFFDEPVRFTLFYRRAPS